MADAIQQLAHSRAARRAVHELDLAALDLHLAEERRKVSHAQLEKARVGALGVDCKDRPAEVEAGL